MNILNRIKLRVRNMKTLSTLITGAEREANKSGEGKAATEHYVLSALALPDGCAKQVFKKLGINADSYRKSIEQQYADALASVGVSAENTEAEAIDNENVFVQASPSGAEFMRSLHVLHAQDKSTPLCGLHVLATVANMKHGVAIRAFQVLGIDPDKLTNVTKQAFEVLRK